MEEEADVLIFSSHPQARRKEAQQVGTPVWSGARLQFSEEENDGQQLKESPMELTLPRGGFPLRPCTVPRLYSASRCTTPWKLNLSGETRRQKGETTRLQDSACVVQISVPFMILLLYSWYLEKYEVSIVCHLIYFDSGFFPRGLLIGGSSGAAPLHLRSACPRSNFSRSSPSSTSHSTFCSSSCSGWTLICKGLCFVVMYRLESLQI